MKMKTKMKKRFRQFMAMFLCVLMVTKVVMPSLATVAASDSNANVNVEHVVLNTGENGEDTENTENTGNNGNRWNAKQSTATESDASKASSSNATSSNAVCEICGNEPCECVICGVCGNKNCTEHTTGSENGPQVGDIVWIRSGSKVYKGTSAENGKTLNGNYEVKIVEVMTDASEQEAWYEFNCNNIFTRIWWNIAVGKEFKYVQVSDTSQSELDTTIPTDEYACTCGESAPENLAEHTDACPRKQYVKSLIMNESGGYKTAQAIYANWDQYDETTKTDILNLLQVYTKTTYDQLTKLINDGQSGTGGNAGTTVDGMEISVEGVPNGITVSAETVVPRDFHLDVFDVIGSKKIVFAVDIKLNNGTDEWQPETGKSVTVSLDAEALGLSDGDKIGILHEHDDKVKKLGTYTVEDGKLTFQTTGFSTFYGYTVDFEYDGTWYSIGGGSGIYLYELFAQLGIERETSEVESVDFTDDTLLEVSEKIVDDAGKTEWYIQSLAPFDTEEVMTITFKTGSPLVINVYDANYTSLSGTVKLQDGDTIGELAIYDDVVLELNGTVTINGKIHIPPGKTLTIQGQGTLKRGDTYYGNLFWVDGTLNINGNEISNNEEHSIILDGGAEWSTTDVPNSTRKKLKVMKGSNVTSAAIYIEINEQYNKFGTVNLENITIQNFYSTNQAPVIFGGQSETSTNYGSVTMNKVIVQKCATIGDMSITLFNECIATLTECKYLNNYSGTRYAGTLKAGGPSHFCQLTMNNCYASGNYSSGWGGVLLWAANRTCGGKESKAVINGCTFEGNTARYLGGAISNEAEMEVKDTILKNNVAMAGGGIATFPYTRTKETDGGGITCGLTLKGNNNIINNEAKASNSFTPFSKLDSESVDGDDILLGANDPIITYTGGGGGVWCYMNKDKWTCSLEIGEGNTITDNAAANAGGGVYIDHVAGTATTLSITGAEISENNAKNGGGVATHNANVTISSGEIKNNTATANGGGVHVENTLATDVTCTISGTGSVKNNQSANGGGIYINGAKLNVTGGVVAFNKAVCQEGVSHQKEGQNNTAFKNAVSCGVGGGIYLAKGAFNMTAVEGSSVGIHSNTADYAAADVYSSSLGTTLTLPKVDGMNLADYSGKATGWYVDYCEGDSEYPNTTIGKENPGRYRETNTNNVQVDSMRLEGTETYYCLTLGKTHGTLKITKKLINADNQSYTATEDQSFLFHVKKKDMNTDPFEMDVAITVKQGQSEASISITNIPEGTYEVTEDGNWSWRFEFVSKLPDSITVSYGNQVPEIIFNNKLKNDHWLSGDCYVKNLFKTDRIERIGIEQSGPAVSSRLKRKGGNV